MKALLKLITCFLTLWLAWWQPSFAQTSPAPLRIGSALNKPLDEAEKLLGRPRHIGEQRERYYKAEGFVRVVVRPTPQNTLAMVTFQFAPGTVKDEREALVRVGLGDAVLPDRWTARWSAPGASKNDELILSCLLQEPTQPRSAAPSGSEKITLTRHFLERMKERGVSEAQARELLESGQHFYDPKNDSYIRYKEGIYIALTKDGTLKTVVRGPISKRWHPL